MSPELLPNLLVETLRQRPLNPMSATDLARAVSADLPLVRATLDKLAAAGRITRDVRRTGAAIAVFTAAKPSDGR